MSRTGADSDPERSRLRKEGGVEECWAEEQEETLFLFVIL